MRFTRVIPASARHRVWRREARRSNVGPASSEGRAWWALQMIGGAGTLEANERVRQGASEQSQRSSGRAYFDLRRRR
jgi:hypothetical protein